jgi:glyoxylate reductase
VTRRLPGQAVERLSERVTVDLWEGDLPPAPEILRERTGIADGVLSLLTDRIDEALFSAAPSLRVVSDMAAGCDNIDLAAATARGIPVGHTPGILAETTADLAFALLLAGARRLVEGDRFVREGRWQTWDPNLLLGQEVHGATLGLVGFGAIGQAMARRAQGFNMRILYNRRSETLPPQGLNATAVPLETLLRESDFVSLHVPLAPETRHLIGARELALMKPTALLINTARGHVVDQEALVDALRAGRPGAAALDVTALEPVPSDDPLLSMPNVIITPHIGSASRATRERMATMAVENLLAGLEGRRMPHCANPEVSSTKS